MQRQQRLQELRRQLLEHSRSLRGDAALRRSAAMPEPTDTPAVVADKILPLAPQPGSGALITPSQVPVGEILPLAPTGAARLPQALPDALPQAFVAPVAPGSSAAVTQDPAAVQAAAAPLKTGGVVDVGSDSRLTERERHQLRQQLRQVLRLQEPIGNR